MSSYRKTSAAKKETERIRKYKQIKKTTPYELSFIARAKISL